MEHIVSFFLGYLFGSIPFGVVLTHLFGIGNLRDIGSGNIGATNVLRTGNKLVALLTLLGDASKGALSVIAVTYLFDDPTSSPTLSLVPLLTALGAFLGHLFPVWLRFNGGKGVATYLGLTLVFGIEGFATFVLVWLLVAIMFRYSSLSALFATLACPVSYFLVSKIDVCILFFCLSILCWLMHRENIVRLIRGEESRIRLGGSD